jgi:hypothetical protein
MYVGSFETDASSEEDFGWNLVFGFVQRAFIHLQVYLKPCDRLIEAHDLPQGGQGGSGRMSIWVSETNGKILREEIFVIYGYTRVIGKDLNLHKNYWCHRRRSRFSCLFYLFVQYFNLERRAAPCVFVRTFHAGFPTSGAASQ